MVAGKRGRLEHMGFTVYILYSALRNRYYTGSSADPYARLKEHNFGRVRSTKNGRPWKLVYIGKYSTRTEAIQRERKIKSYKHGEAFKRLLRYVGKNDTEKQ